jgi:hypothetical protein
LSFVQARSLGDGDDEDRAGLQSLGNDSAELDVAIRLELEVALTEAALAASHSYGRTAWDTLEEQSSHLGAARCDGAVLVGKRDVDLLRGEWRR